MAATAASGLPQPPQHAADQQAGGGDVLASIRRMIAENEQGAGPLASPLRPDSPLRLDSPLGEEGLPTLRLGRGDSPEATRLRATALREAIRARVPGAEAAEPEPAPPAAAPVVEAPAAVIEAAVPAALPSEALPPEPRAMAAAMPQPPVQAPVPEPGAGPAASFFGEMIREVLRQELRGESLERMSGDLRSMVLREVARAIIGGPAEGAGS